MYKLVVGAMSADGLAPLRTRTFTRAFVST